MLKAPRVGAVKSRLARDIGPVKAWQFYRRTVTAVNQRLNAPSHWQTHLLVSPDRSACKTRQWPKTERIFAQNQGDLGERMLRGLRSGRRGVPVVLVGGDIPDVLPQHIRRAFQALGHADMVFGPATDGGFWLVGWNGRRPLFKPFRGARWSTPHALSDCLKQITHRRVVLVNELSDVDTAADLRSL